MSEHILAVSDDSFEADVLKSDIPVLVDFWAEWCGPCKQLAPRVDEAAEQFKGQMKFCKVDIEESRDLAVKYGIRSIPSLVIFKDGEVSSSEVGALTSSQLNDFLEKEI